MTEPPTNVTAFTAPELTNRVLTLASGQDCAICGERRPPVAGAMHVRGRVTTSFVRCDRGHLLAKVESRRNSVSIRPYRKV